MKNCVKWFCVVVTIIGFLFVSCKKDSLDGTTWKANYEGSEVVLKFNNSNFTLEFDDDDLVKGSYAVSGITVTMAIEDDDDEAITGTIAGNTLSLTSDGETVKLKKQ